MAPTRQALSPFPEVPSGYPRESPRRSSPSGELKFAPTIVSVVCYFGGIGAIAIGARAAQLVVDRCDLLFNPVIFDGRMI